MWIPAPVSYTHLDVYKRQGQVDLFGLSAAADSAVADWSEAQRLAGERETLGLFLSGHPITPYEPDLKFLVGARLADVGGPKDVYKRHGSWSMASPLAASASRCRRGREPGLRAWWKSAAPDRSRRWASGYRRPGRCRP